jgi:hypothetical protein
MQQVLNSTLRNILSAIVKTLLRNGMPYGEFDQIARKCFVDVAASEFTTPGKKQTVSNIAILTGLNRKEVKKLRECDVDQIQQNTKQYNRSIRVLGGWINDPEFLRKDGNPRDLEYEGPASFSELVRKYSGDMPVAAMQKALTRSANIQFTDDGKLRLLSHAYLPSDDPVEKLAILGVDTRQLIETIDHNLTATEESLRFQRKASNPKVSTHSLPEVKQFIQRKGQSFLEEVDLYLSQHESDDDSASELSIGVYFHQADGNDQRVKDETD